MSHITAIWKRASVKVGLIVGGLLLVQSAILAHELATTESWIETHCSDWPPAQRSELLGRLSGVLENYSGDLGAERARELEEWTPAFLALGGTPAQLSDELTLQEIEERYSMAVRACVERKPLTGEALATLQAQRTRIFGVIDTHIDTIVAASEPELGERIREAAPVLRAYWVKAWENPLSPYFKRPLTSNEEAAWHQEIEARLGVFAAGWANADQEDGPMYDGIPMVVISMIRMAHDSEAYAPLESERLLAIRQAQRERFAEAEQAAEVRRLEARAAAH